MPQVTVIPSDTIIIVDGEVIHCPFEAPATLHAVQWDGKKGHIEYTDGKLNKPLSGEADYLTYVLPYVDLWKAEKKRLEAEQPQYEEPTLAEQVRAERDAKIKAVRWRIERHKDELELGIPPTEPLEPLLQYVQALRDVPAQTGFPENVEWPVEP